MTTTTAADPAVFDRAIEAITERGWGKMPGATSLDHGGALCLGYAIAAAMGKRYQDTGWKESPEMEVLAQAAAARYPERAAQTGLDGIEGLNAYPIAHRVNDYDVSTQDEAISILADAKALAEQQ